MAVPEHVSIWTAALDELRGQFTKAAFQRYLEGSQVVGGDLSSGKLVVALRNQYAADWVGARFDMTIRRTLRNLAGREIRVEYVAYAPELHGGEPAVSPSKNGNGGPSPAANVEPGDTHAERSGHGVNGHGPAGTSGHGLESGAALFEEEFIPLTFLVESMLAKGNLCVLGGRPKSGKSWLMLQAAHAIDTGRTFLDKPTQRGPVLFIDQESTRRRAHERLHLLRWKPAETAFLFQVAYFDGDGGPGPGLAQLEKLAPDFDLIVVDTLIATLSGRVNENDNAQMAAIVNNLARIAHNTDTAIVLVHHTGKGTAEDPFDLLRGASAIRGGYDLGMLLERKQGEREALLHVESRDFESYALTIRQAEDGAGWETLGDGLKLKEIRAGKKAAQAMSDHGDPVTVDELATLLGVTKQAAHKQLLNLERDGFAGRVSEEREGTFKPVDLWSLR